MPGCLCLLLFYADQETVDRLGTLLYIDVDFVVLFNEFTYTFTIFIGRILALDQGNNG